MNPTIGESCVFVDANGKRRHAQIVAVHEPERGQVDRGEAGSPNWVEEEIRGIRVDLIYSPNAHALDPATALNKFHALHRTQQVPDNTPRHLLRNYWEEGAP